MTDMKLRTASGDLRNVIQSVASLPPIYDQRVNIVLNDLDLDTVARNLIMLLVLLAVEQLMFAQLVPCGAVRTSN